MIGLYKITSPSGKVYIGQSVNVKRRMADHKRLLGRGQRKLHCSLKSYGVDSHIFEIICSLPQDIDQSILNEYEQLFMDQYRECGVVLLNIKEGGNGYGKHTEETKALLRVARSKQVFSEETQLKKSISLKKVVHTREWNMKVGQSQKGKVIPQWQIEAKKKPLLQFSTDGELIAKWDSSRNAGRTLGIIETSICNNLTGRSKSAGGFKWKYA